MTGIFLSLIFISCGKDNDDDDKITNADLSGDYEGLLNVESPDTSYSFVTIISFTKETGNNFIVSSETEDIGTVTTKGNTYKGSGAAGSGVDIISGSISGNNLILKATLEDGGEATFAGEKIIGGGSSGSDITINNQKYVLNQTMCDTESMSGIYQLSGNQLEVANIVLVFEGSPQTGTYEVSYDSLPSSNYINASVLYQFETVYGSKGTVTVTNTGGKFSATLSNINFDFDALGQSIVTPVIVKGSLTCN